MKKSLIFLFTLTLIFLLFSLSTLSADGTTWVKQTYISDNIETGKESESTGAVLMATVYSSGITTDASDYAPGDSVVIVGTGFWTSEAVSVEVNNVYNPGFGDSGGPWTVYADGAGN